SDHDSLNGAQFGVPGNRGREFREPGTLRMTWARAIPPDSAALARGWAVLADPPRPARKRGSRPRLPLLNLLLTGDLRLGDHLAGEPFAVHRELVVVNPRSGLPFSIQVPPVPEGPIFSTAQSEAIQPLARAIRQSGNGDHLHQHIVDLQADHRLMTPPAHRPGNLKGDGRRREKRIGVVLLELDPRREHVRLCRYRGPRSHQKPEPPPRPHEADHGRSSSNKV